MPDLGTAMMEHLESPDCDRTPLPPDVWCLRLPFGIKICSGRASMFKFEGPDTMILSFLNLIQPLISPMMAILILASMVKALVDCVKAIPEAIGSFSPGPIIACLEKLAKIFPQLFEYIPPFSYIPTLVDFVRALIFFVDTIVEIIQTILISAQNALQFQIKVDALPGLGKYQECIDDEIAAQYQQVANALNASGPLFKVLATFLGLLDIPPLRPFVGPLIDFANALDDISSGSASDVFTADFITSLEDVQKILRDVDNALKPFAPTA